jgi:hypothetical protein
MIKAFIKTRKPAFWVYLHLLLGIAFAFVRPLFMVWFIVVALSSISMLTQGSKEKQAVNFVFFLSYMASLELMSRMTQAFKYGLPWEYGKYFVFFASLYALLVLQLRKGTIGFALLFLILPSLLISSVHTIDRKDIVFNGLGPLAICFLIITLKDVKISRAQLIQLLRLLLYPALMVLAYTVIRTPDLDSIEFTLGANFKTAGGFGSNQVATIQGLGLFLSFLFWINRWYLTGNRVVDTLIMAGFAFQGLLSFSRGGMIGGALAIIVYLFFVTKASSREAKRFNLPKVGKYVLPALITIALTFQIVDSITSGLLSLRYRGETTKTVLGEAEVDLNTLTTGRFDIFQNDLEIWNDYFVLGTGIGGSTYLRNVAEGIDTRSGHNSSHVELSRLLSEHGLLGLFFFLLLVYIGFQLATKPGNPKYKGILVAFYALAIYTTFHAATRTYITPLLVGLSMLKVYDSNEPEIEVKTKKQYAIPV